MIFNLINHSKKYIILLLFFIFLLNFNIVNAYILKDVTDYNPSHEGQMNSFTENAGFETTTDMGEVVAIVINAFLGVLAIIFIIILIMAGYKYMTAGGNEDKTKEAIDSIRRAIIGLIIVVSAYAITYFVFNSMTWFGTGAEVTGS